MEFRHLGSLAALFCLAVLGSHVQASLHAEDYWRSLWPNTPMPKALRDLKLHDSEWDGWNWRAEGRNALPWREVRTALPWKSEGRNALPWREGRNALPWREGRTALPWKPEGRNALPWREEGRTDGDAAPPAKVLYGAVRKDEAPKELKDTLNVTFFFEHDLHPGKKLKLGFTKHTDEFFLPDKVAKSIPFSSSRFPEILNYFHMEAKSTEAEIVKHTIEICENPAVKGEVRYCATSLESMLNFTISKLGKNIRVLSTVLEKKTQKQQLYQQYSVVEGVQKAGDKAMVCHKLSYPYAVFYCHKDAARAYTVPLVAADDGAKVKGLAVCHTDTSHRNPDQAAFQQLNVKPGTVPICHFLDTDTLLWVPN